MNTVDMDLHCATKPLPHGKVTISRWRLIGQRRLLIGYIGYKKYVACGNIIKLKNDSHQFDRYSYRHFQRTNMNDLYSEL